MSTNFLLSFVRLNKVLQNSTPRKVAYLWQIERVQKDAIKFKRQQIKFSSDVFIAVFVKKKYVRGERHHPPPIAINPQHPSPRYIWNQRSRRSLWKILDCDFNSDCFNQGLLYSRSREKFPYSKRFQEEGVINITLQRLESKFLLKRGSIRTACPLLISLLKRPAGLMLLSRIKLLIYLPRAEGAGAPNPSFWRISVGKTMWDLEFSVHVL